MRCESCDMGRIQIWESPGFHGKFECTVYARKKDQTRDHGWYGTITEPKGSNFPLPSFIAILPIIWQPTIVETLRLGRCSGPPKVCRCVVHSLERQLQESDRERVSPQQRYQRREGKHEISDHTYFTFLYYCCTNSYYVSKSGCVVPGFEIQLII